MHFLQRWGAYCGILLAASHCSPSPEELEMRRLLNQIPAHGLSHLQDVVILPTTVDSETAALKSGKPYAFSALRNHKHDNDILLSLLYCASHDFVQENKFKALRPHQYVVSESAGDSLKSGTLIALLQKKPQAEALPLQVLETKCDDIPKESAY